MSRMIAYVAPSAVELADALGSPLLEDFAALARLHADGWGTAWVERSIGTVRIDGGIDPTLEAADLSRRMLEVASVRMLYLRFASKGAAPSPENTQPFLHDGAAFQHNGLIAPRDALIRLLSRHRRAELRGSTDSEAYFAVIRDRLRSDPGVRVIDNIARGVAAVRAQFAGACLNAMLCTPQGLWVVNSPGTARVPLNAFEERGVRADDLPPEHDENYNVLRMTTTQKGVHVVATTGVDQRGWDTLPVDSVTSIETDRITSVAL